MGTRATFLPASARCRGISPNTLGPLRPLQNPTRPRLLYQMAYPVAVQPPERLARSRSVEQLGEPRHEGLVGYVEPYRRHRDAIVGQRLQIGPVGGGRPRAARKGDPVIRITA